MAKLSGVYCCGCDVETPCEWGDLNLGKLFQCPACLETRVSILSRGGTKVWIKVDPEDIEFHDLLKDPASGDADAT